MLLYNGKVESEELLHRGRIKMLLSNGRVENERTIASRKNKSKCCCPTEELRGENRFASRIKTLLSNGRVESRTVASQNQTLLSNGRVESERELLHRSRIKRCCPTEELRVKNYLHR